MSIEAELDQVERNSCPACGSSSQTLRGSCEICGKLISEGFQPLDAIRSSYRMQRKSLDMRIDVGDSVPLFDEPNTLISNTPWACAVYSMVPYLGILFVPLALATGSYSYLKAQRNEQGNEAGRALMAMGISILVLAVQIVLWWLLYLIPEIGL